MNTSGMMRRLRRHTSSLLTVLLRSNEAWPSASADLGSTLGARMALQGPGHSASLSSRCAALALFPAPVGIGTGVVCNHITGTPQYALGNCWHRSLHVSEGVQDSEADSGGGYERDAGSVVLCQRISKARDAEELAHLIGLHEDSLNYFSLSTAFARLPKVLSESRHPQGTDAALLNRLVDMAIDTVDDLDDVGVAIVLWSLAKLRCTREDMLMELESSLPLHLPFMRAQSISNTVWALGTLNRPQPSEVVSQLLRSIEMNLKFFNSQGLANVVWGMARMGWEEDQDLLGLLANKAAEIVTRSLVSPDAQRLDGEAGHYQSAGARAAGNNVHPQEVANLLWGFASLRHPGSKKFLEAALQHCEQNAQRYKPQELSNFCWALASMHQLGTARRCNIVPVLMAVEGTSVQRMSHFRAQEFSSMLHSFAVIVPALKRGSHTSPGGASGRQAGDLLLSKSCAAISQGLLAGLTPQAISNIMWSLATMRHVPTPSVLETLLQEADKQGFALFTDQAISNILWACGELNYHPSPNILVKAIGELLSRVSLSPQSVGCSLWALAVLDAVTPKVFGALVSKADVADQVTLCQIWQAHASLDQSAEQVWQPEAQKVIEAAKNAQLESIRNVEHMCTTSSNHKDVLLALKTMGVPHATDSRVGPDESRLADILLKTTPPVAIEIDGPLHYATNRQRYPLGGTVLRNRMLERAGIPVISIHWLDWQDDVGTMTQKQEMLTRAIKLKYQQISQ